MEEKNKGLSIHCRHNILVEYCYDYEGRVAVINGKPLGEVETRLKLFKMLSDEAIADLPEAWVKADKIRVEAYKVWVEVEVCTAREEACTAHQDAVRAYREIYKAWNKTDKARWHQKWCGCTEWDGEQILFLGRKK